MKGVAVVPVYVLCPHCEHPHVVPPHRRGKRQFCRQCGQLFQTFEQAAVVRPLACSSIAEFRGTKKRQANLYVIEV